MASIHWIFFLLVQSSWGYMEETYPLMEEVLDPSPYLYPDELAVKNEVHRRNSNNYLRFGRADPASEDYEFDEDFTRPTRSGKTEKNDHFIRFGRGRQDFMRFGRDSHKDRTNYLRFGRSIPDDSQKRIKREAAFNEDEFKRGSNFLRFGRNSNFMRFGRPDPLANMMVPTVKSATDNSAFIKKVHDTSLWQLLNEILVNLKMNNNRKCTV